MFNKARGTILEVRFAEIFTRGDGFPNITLDIHGAFVRYEFH